MQTLRFSTILTPRLQPQPWDTNILDTGCGMTVSNMSSLKNMLALFAYESNYRNT